MGPVPPRVTASLPARVAIALVVGLAVGAATSLLQRYLDFPWLALVNAASPWLIAAFAVGATMRGPRGAALAGFSTCLLELVGYYVTAVARGYTARNEILLFWSACALVGGPVFGAAGWSWWRGPANRRALGAAVLPAAFLAEAAVVYAWRLNYVSSAVLFSVIGVALVALLGLRGRQHTRVVRWLLVVFPVAVASEIVFVLVASSSF